MRGERDNARLTERGVWGFYCQVGETMNTVRVERRGNFIFFYALVSRCMDGWLPLEIEREDNSGSKSFQLEELSVQYKLIIIKCFFARTRTKKTQKKHCAARNPAAQFSILRAQNKTFRLQVQ